MESQITRQRKTRWRLIDEFDSRLHIKHRGETMSTKQILRRGIYLIAGLLSAHRVQDRRR